MGKPTIKVVDAVYCRADKRARRLIKPALAYQSSVWKRNKKTGRKEQVITKCHFITGRKGTSGKFLTGLLPRIIDYTDNLKLNKKIKVIDNSISIKPQHLPKLKGITFRQDQRKALRAVRRHHRGKIVFPTGSGKTIIAGGIISMFPDCRTLFLCHTKDLLFQSMHAFERFGFEVIVYGGGYKIDNPDKIFKKEKCLMLATIQSFSKIPPKKHIGFFDLTIVDEEHHVNSKDSQYGQLMESNLSPRRYVLTATIPTKRHQLLVNEGYFGPIIAELTVEEGIDLGIIAKPMMNIVPVPYNVKINKKCKGTYKKFYEYGIVKNRVRNKLIADEVIKSIREDEVVLVIIERKEHGKQIQNMLKYKGVKIPFVFGDTKKEERSRVKKRLQNKKLKCAICSKIWKEGVNIPSLNHIVNAVGLKEEKAVLQAAGRGLRTTEDKSTIRITDFLDPYRYLAEHSVLRMAVYLKKGWFK
jgi:superfamily II DNA or RNA helicase